jgi:plasmid stabilization system protein ParE
LRHLGYPYWTARAQLDRAEWLARQGKRDESARLAGAAAATFEKLGAEPMLVRSRVLLEAETYRKPSADGERVVAQSHPSLSE